MVRTIRRLQAENKKTSTWDKVAAPKTAKKEVPLAKGKVDVIVSPDPTEVEIRKRGSTTLKEIRAQVGPIAEGARRLPDGNTVIRVAAEKEADLLQNMGWAVVFGRKARIIKGGHKVLIKGIPEKTLDSLTENEIKDKCNALSFNKKKGPSGYGTLLCQVPDIETAAGMTRKGVTFGSQVFRCEPFSPQGKARQCYNCYEWGHIAN